MEGDHFLSDTIMSFIITYVIIKGLNDIFKNFPEDLNLNQLKKPSWLSRKNPIKIHYNFISIDLYVTLCCEIFF